MAEQLLSRKTARSSGRYKRAGAMSQAARIASDASPTPEDIKHGVSDRDFYFQRAGTDGLLRGRKALAAAVLRMAIRDAFVSSPTRPEDHPAEYAEDDGDEYYTRDEAYKWLFGDTATLMWDILDIDAGKAQNAIRQWREEGVRMVARGYEDKWRDAQGNEIHWTRNGWQIVKRK
jgi:hypothetical protein